jgi:hypothetical protein
MRILHKLLLGAALAGTFASAGTLLAEASQQSASDSPPSIVEDFTYPGADAILATYGVTLISGDGHLLFVDCATPPTGSLGLIQVHTLAAEGADNQGLICFKVTGPTGHLNLKVPAVFDITGDGTTPGAGHKLTAALTTDAGVQTTVSVNPSGTTPVGVGAKPGNPPTTLLQLDASS